MPVPEQHPAAEDGGEREQPRCRQVGRRQVLVDQDARERLVDAEQDRRGGDEEEVDPAQLASSTGGASGVGATTDSDTSSAPSSRSTTIVEPGASCRAST